MTRIEMESLKQCEEQSKSLLPPLGHEGKAGGAFQSYLKRKPVWNAIKKEIEKEQQELTPYSLGIDMPMLLK